MKAANPDCEYCGGTGKYWSGGQGGDYEACTCTKDPGKTPLQQMIDLWEGIVRLHNDDLSRPVEKTTLAQFTRDDRLKAKAQMVLAALVHYQIELER